MTTMEIKNEQRKGFVNTIISAMESGNLPWRAEWLQNAFSQLNASTQKAYRGSNAILLAFLQNARKYTQPLWLTYKQATALGGKVKKGSKGVGLTFWDIKNVPVQDKDGNNIVNPDGSIKMRKKVTPRYFTVFNIAQCDFEEDKLKSIMDKVPNVKNLLTKFKPNQLAETILNSGCKYEETTTETPCYIPALDIIQLPKREVFESETAFYSTAMHEKVHSTGHESRCARDIKNKFGTPEYAFEELIAEIGSVLLSQQIGLPNINIKNHAAYIKSWLKALKEDNNLLFTVFDRAYKAMEFILKDAKLDGANPTINLPAVKKPATVATVQKPKAQPKPVQPKVEKPAEQPKAEKPKMQSKSKAKTKTAPITLDNGKKLSGRKVAEIAEKVEHYIQESLFVA